MTAPRIYLETTIPSYLVSRASRDPILRGQQEATRKWWHANRNGGQWFVSVFVEMEVSKGHPEAAAKRLAAIHGMDILLTWNCTHIHNVAITRRIETICARAGHVCPLICTPFDLLAP